MTDTECPNGIRKRRPIYLAFRYVCPYDVGGALMCVVSAVSDYYMRPNTWPPNSIPNQPQWVPTVPFDQETKDALKEIVKRLDEIDKKLKDRECMDDKKVAFFKVIGYSPEEGT